MHKKLSLTILLIFCITILQPTPVHASFFLFNIIRDIFGGAPHSTPPPKPTPAASSNSSVIKLGMRSSQVTEVQQYLINAKYLSGKSDGIFGYQTQQAIKMFQRDSGLSDDGVVGSRTMSALKNFKGTKPKRNSPPPQQQPYYPPQNDNGVPHYLYATPMLVTAYTRYDEGCTDYTYRGTYLRKGLCAVDPNVIPLGTKLYIPGYGEAIADDIGGAIIGNHIDLAMDTLDEAFTWGKRDVTVYVLPKG